MYKRLEEKQVVLGRLRVIYMHQRAKYIKQNGTYVRVSSLKGGAGSPTPSPSFPFQDLPEEEIYRTMKQLIRDSKEGLNVNETSSVLSVASANNMFKQRLLNIKEILFTKMKTITVQNISQIDYSQRDYSQGVYSLQFSPDGSKLLSVSMNDTVKVWNIAKGNTNLQDTISIYPGEDKSKTILSPNATIGATALDNGLVKLWNIQTKTHLCELVRLPDGAVIIDMAFHPDGKLLATTPYEKPVIRIWTIQPITRDTYTCSFLKELTCPKNDIQQILFSPNGNTLAAVSDYSIFLWRKEENLWQENPFATYEMTRKNTIYNMCFSPDGRMLMINTGGSKEKHIKIVQVNTDKSLGPEMAYIRDAHKKLITAMVFSPDGKTFATAGGRDDPTVKLWYFYKNEWKNIITFTGHKDTPMSLAFSPDGSMLVSGGDNGMILLRDIRPILAFYQD